jgi:hypothetical protein
MKPVDQAISLAQQSRSQSTPQSYLGIVSPCSTCINQRSLPSADGRPACPRRFEASLKQQIDANGMDSSTSNLVTLASNGVVDDGTKPLTNPVYDNADNAILIWVAAFKDNAPKVDSTGQLLSPDILDPNFSTDWIVCQNTPVVPQDSEAQYFQKGCMMQGDQIQITISTSQQIMSQAGTDPISLQVSGTAKKINAYSLFPRLPVTKDLAVAGT